MLSGIKRWFNSVKVHRIPQGTFIFDRLVPVLLIMLGVITLLVILYALAILAGLIRLG